MDAIPQDQTDKNHLSNGWKLLKPVIYITLKAIITERHWLLNTK